jgi:biuret amidohydrolase
MPIWSVATNNCVLCTAFEAFNRDLQVILLEDCCASMNGSPFHESAVLQINTSLGWVTRSDRIEDVLNGKKEIA